MAKEREVEGDLVHGDMGDGLPFRAGVFDGAISISALQWLCNADKSHHKPAKRLASFFASLYGSLVRKYLFKKLSPSNILAGAKIYVVSKLIKSRTLIPLLRKHV